MKAKDRADDRHGADRDPDTEGEALADGLAHASTVATDGVNPDHPPKVNGVAFTPVG